MVKSKPATKSEAIELAIRSKPMGDFMDVVNEVQKQFGMKVTQVDVEETYLEMKKQARAAEASQPEASVEDSGSDGKQPDKTSRTLQFVEAMGGFENARAAIDQLESTIRKLRS